jgi:hypothetical protein
MVFMRASPMLAYISLSIIMISREFYVFQSIVRFNRLYHGRQYLFRTSFSAPPTSKTAGLVGNSDTVLVP